MEFVVKKFHSKPNFSISFDVKSDAVPEEVQEKWESALHRSDNPNLFISSKQSFRCLEAKWRYTTLTLMYRSLLEKSNRPWPSLLLFLAEAHFLLSDSRGCLNYLQLLSQLLPNDEKLSHLIRIMDQLLLDESIQDDNYHNQTGVQGITLYTFSTPIEYPTIPPMNESLQTLLTNWERLKSKEDDAINLLQRYACVSSNILEDVFSLEGQSWSRLIRFGFDLNSIDGISLTSKQKNKRIIIKILKNTLTCFELISSCLDDPTKFTPTFLIQLHTVLLQNNNFLEDDEDSDISSGPTIMLIPTGRFRSISCLTEHNNGKVITQYCHPRNIESQMERYCALARNLLQNDEIDAFIKVAWLQWAFLRIHPFADGNGRVSRIISSIPLYKLHLPPVVVHQNHKSPYFQAIHQADRESNLEPLANLFKSSILSAIQDILTLPADSEIEKTSEEGKTKTRKVGRLAVVKVY